MPTYEYRCPNGHDFERFYKTISAAASEAECPDCGQMAGRQLSAGAGLLFKGSGFYLTDYGKNAHRGAKPDAAPSGSDAGAKPDAAKSETKAESPKPDAKPAAESKPAKPKPKPKAK